MPEAQVNGIRLWVSEAGPPDGELLILLHGFPELGYSWRHQIPALAEAGYRVITPDLRGYGRSDAPAGIEAYAIDLLAADVTGLIDREGRASAVVIGHDWGADLAWKTAWQRPDRVSAVVGVSVPFVPRAPAPPLGIMREHLGEDFYIVWMQEPGIAEAALSQDVRRTIATTKQWTAEWARQTDDHPPTPPFMSGEELAVYVGSYERTGFAGGLNYYRAIDLNWERTAPVSDRRIEMPALFVTGERDPVRRFMPAEAMDGWVTNLRDAVVVPGAGHWVNQERPAEVNDALLRFLASLRDERP